MTLTTQFRKLTPTPRISAYILTLSTAILVGTYITFGTSGLLALVASPFVIYGAVLTSWFIVSLGQAVVCAGMMVLATAVAITSDPATDWNGLWEGWKEIPPYTFFSNW